MNLKYYTLVTTLLLSLPCSAADLYNAKIQLNRKSININTYPTKDVWRTKVVISSGNSSYSTDYNSADGDVPNLRWIFIDRKKSPQLLLETAEAGSCVYHILSISTNKIIPLLKLDTGPACLEPQAQGNGKLSVNNWEGFWKKEDQYILSNTETKLTMESTHIYDVNVVGAANKSFTFSDSECKPLVATPGLYIKVKSYNSITKQYKLETLDGGCSWIDEEQISTKGELVRGLPWAG